MLDRLLFKKHLEDDEIVIRVVHKHWALAARTLFWPTTLFVASIGLLSLSHARGMVIVVAVVAVVLLVWWIQRFLDYFLDAWLVTDHGIIDVEWFGWFHRQSTRVLYSDLHGVSYEIKGILGTFLRYGTISIEKISTGSEISLPYVRNPKSVEFTILEQMEKYLHTKNLKDSKHVQEILSAIVAEQVQIKQMQLPKQ